jgi:hypothetical protein
MTIHMNDEQLMTIEQLESFTQASGGMIFHAASRKEKYEWIERFLKRFMYFSQRKKNRTIIKNYILIMTGYSQIQLKRLIKTQRKTKHLAIVKTSRRFSFPSIYTTDDVALLAKTDEAHRRLSGPATKEIFERAYHLFHDEAFIHLKDISVAHIYRLRGRRQYLSATTTFTKTNPTSVPIGERRKPIPNGKPGHLRVDSVHQGDKEKEKGAYHINIVDEVTQWEIIGCVEGISERFLAPLLEELLKQFPFVILEFHSDNGSEYINYVVAKLLNKLSIAQTKSRPRRCNDNALVEGKNGAIIRKHIGHIHIARHHAEKINKFYQTHFNAYINYHRPCGYATTVVNAKGKETKVYNLYETPYDHFKNLPDAEMYLREGLTFEKLDAIAYAKSDNDCATLMKEAKETLFKAFR